MRKIPCVYLSFKPGILRNPINVETAAPQDSCTVFKLELEGVEGVKKNVLTKFGDYSFHMVI